MSNRNEDDEIVYLKAGTVRREDGESWTHWVVYDRSVVESEWAESFDGKRGISLENCAKEDSEELIRWLAGWARSYSGPGRAFHSEPNLRLYKKKILVTQYGGLDI